jgi:hypothetical protein
MYSIGNRFKTVYKYGQGSPVEQYILSALHYNYGNIVGLINLETGVRLSGTAKRVEKVNTITEKEMEAIIGYHDLEGVTVPYPPVHNYTAGDVVRVTKLTNGCGFKVGQLVQVKSIKSDYLGQTELVCEGVLLDSNWLNQQIMPVDCFEPVKEKA